METFLEGKCILPMTGKLEAVTVRDTDKGHRERFFLQGGGEEPGSVEGRRKRATAGP